MMKRNSNITFIGRYDKIMKDEIKYDRNKPNIIKEINAYKKMKKMMNSYCMSWCMANEYGDIIYQNVSINFHDKANLGIKKMLVFSPPYIYVTSPKTYYYKFVSKRKIISHAIGCHVDDLEMRLKEITINNIKIVAFGKEDTKDSLYFIKMIENRWRNKLTYYNKDSLELYENVWSGMYSMYKHFMKWSVNMKYTVYEKNYAFWHMMEKETDKVKYSGKFAIKSLPFKIIHLFVKCGRTYIARYMKNKFPNTPHRSEIYRRSNGLSKNYLRTQKRKSNKFDY
jgi:hypothetical protein